MHNFTIKNLYRLDSCKFPVHHLENFWKADLRVKEGKILSWLGVKKPICSDEKLKIEDLEINEENIYASFYNEVVDIEIVKKFFEPDGFNKLQRIVMNFRKSKWVCFNCGKDESELNKSNKCVCCDGCMIWFHIECEGGEEIEKEEDWFCSHCKKVCNQ